MPIELTWLVPDMVILSRWIADVTEDDMLVLVDELGLILDTATRPIHTVIDMSDVMDISPNAGYGYLQSRIPTHPNRGRVGLVSPSFQGQVLADMLNRISQLEQFRFFDTRAEARDYLLIHDTPPPPLQPDEDANRVDDSVIP